MAMTQASPLQGGCPAPFLQESLFAKTGYVQGRFCASLPGLAGGENCCLQCPATEWIYPDNFYSLTRISGYLAWISMALCAFMLVSFAALPIDKTRRNYLNVCLLISIIILELGIVVPFTRRPDPCHDLITPNDEHSSMTCAWSGGLAVFGGAAVTLWILIRAVSMHLQICWDIVPGVKYYWGAQILGWALAATLLAVEMSVVGTSTRFGDICHVNSRYSIGAWWGPLLGLAGLSLLFQLMTFAYCLKVYLSHSLAPTLPDTESSHGASPTPNRNAHARAVFRRVRTVLAIQWRGIAIAVAIVSNVIFLSVVFVILDEQVHRASTDIESLMPWLTCMVVKGDKNECLDLSGPLAVNQTLLIATLILLSIGGIEVFILICTRDMFVGWVTLARRMAGRRKSQQDFISLREPAYGSDKGTHEMQSYGSPDIDATSPKRMSEKSGALISPLTRIENTNYRTSPYGPPGDDERSYQSPKRSFSKPRPPSARSPGLGWEGQFTTKNYPVLQTTFEEVKY